jgi:hypothetical protein
LRRNRQREGRGEERRLWKKKEKETSVDYEIALWSVGWMGRADERREMRWEKKGGEKRRGARIREYSRRGTTRMMKERRKERKEKSFAVSSRIQFYCTSPLSSSSLIALHVRTVRFFVRTYASSRSTLQHSVDLRGEGRGWSRGEGKIGRKKRRRLG